MTIVFRYDGALLPYQSVRMTGGSTGGVAGLPSAARAGEPSVAGIQIDDPAGIYNFSGWHEFTVDETACSKPRIFTGWLGAKRISRGPYRTGPGRVWDCDIIDQNAVFSFKAYRDATAKRPAETDLVRVAFALAHPSLSSLLFDNGAVNLTDLPVPLGDSDYVKQFPAELFASLSPSGKNFYAYWDNSAQQISLFYDRPDAAVRVSTLRLSNVLSDLDATTFAPSRDAELLTDPTETYSNILYGWQGGTVYHSRALTATNFIDRDQVYETTRVGKIATAHTQAESFLDDHAGERDSITCIVQLPAASVNLLDAGELVDVRFEHLPGYEGAGFTPIRVMRRNVIPTADEQDLYDVHLELSLHGLSRGPGGGDPSGFPHQAQPPSLVQYKIGEGSIILDEPPTPGNVLLVWSAIRVGTLPAGWTVIDTVACGGVSGRGQMGWRIAGASSLSFTAPKEFYSLPIQSATIIMEFAGVDSVDTFASIDNHAADALVTAGGPVSPTPGLSAVIVGGATMGTSDLDSIRVTPDVGWTELLDLSASTDTQSPHAWVAYKTVAATSGSYTPQGTNSINPTATYGGVTVVLTGGADQNPPASGQWVFGEVPSPTPDGVETTFATTFTFADGSLRVYVDRLDQTLAVTSYDGETGEFTLGFAPAVGMLVEVDYQAR